MKWVLRAKHVHLKPKATLHECKQFQADNSMYE